ncbi:MAG: response regulator, partial [Cyanobacteria bacterium P01_E01_bin.35]
MNGKALKILLVEDNLADASWISQILEEYSWQKSNLRHVKKVTEAIDTLSQDSFDAILLDLSLPDSEGITSLDIVKQKAPQLPIVVLTATDDPKVAIKSLRQGAQDYLIKGEFEGKLLTRSIQYAIERQRTKFNLRQQALMKKMLDRIRNSIDLDAIL